MSKARPGPLNLITDVEGLAVGQADDPVVRTGVTVILADRLSPAACEVCGGGPATRETDALRLESLVGGLDAVVFSGGSVYGLAACDAVTAVLGARGRGFQRREIEGVPASPLVGGAALFDLAHGGDKAWGESPPYAALGRAALASVGDRFELGTAGAGYGAMAGALKGGIGSASAVTADGITVGALVAANPVGSVVGPDGRTFWAAPFEIDGEFGGVGPSASRAVPDAWPYARIDPTARANTTLACVATDAALTAPELKRVAAMARAGLAHAIRPVFTPFDGDVVFALSTGRREAPEPRALTVMRIGTLAADALARAIARGVYEARAYEGSPAPDWKSTNPSQS
jgi:L-aminopeptidase/D-esterase-like protein